MLREAFCHLFCLAFHFFLSEGLGNEEIRCPSLTKALQSLEQNVELENVFCKDVLRSFKFTLIFKSGCIVAHQVLGCTRPFLKKEVLTGPL